MDTRETEIAIKDLQTQVASMKEALDKRYQIDKFSSDEIKDGLREVVDDKIAESVWDGFFYHSGITPLGTVTSVANTEDVERFRISARDSATLSVNRPSKMRVAFYFDDGTNGGSGCVAYISTVHTRSTVTPVLDTDAEFVGFKIENGLFNIMAYNRGSSTISPTSVTISNESSYLCEIRYHPRERADFFINNKYVGSISKNLPNSTIFTDAYVFNTIHVSLKGTNGATHNLVVDYYEFIQDRN